MPARSVYDGMGYSVPGVFGITNIYTGTAADTSSTVDLGDTNKAIAFRGEEDFYYLPVSSDSDTVSDSTGYFCPAGQEDYLYMQDNQYLAILRKGSTSGDVWIKELGGNNY